jgi:hypothetical protein
MQEETAGAYREVGFKAGVLIGVILIGDNV